MLRLGLKAIFLIMFLCSPTLCVSGVLEHLCAEGSETVSCNHEDGCAEDPCLDVALRPEFASKVLPFGAPPDLFTPIHGFEPYPAALASLPVPEMPPGLDRAQSSSSAPLPLRI